MLNQIEADHSFKHRHLDVLCNARFESVNKGSHYGLYNVQPCHLVCYHSGNVSGLAGRAGEKSGQS